jgi:flagellar biosynthesis anti-sigma factor FlgM
MKIDANSPPVVPLATVTNAKQTSNLSSTTSQTAYADRTTFHSDNLSVQSLTSQAMSLADVRGDKVVALRQSISSGEYQPDSARTADGIIESSGANGYSQ